MSAMTERKPTLALYFCKPGWHQITDNNFGGKALLFAKLYQIAGEPVLYLQCHATQYKVSQLALNNALLGL